MDAGAGRWRDRLVIGAGGVASLIPARQAVLAVRAPAEELEAAFADYLRLDVAQGAASAGTVRSYWSNVRHYLRWCEEREISPTAATEEDLKTYRADLVVQGYARSTIATRLCVVRIFYRMVQARGYRTDNPATGLRPPPERTERAERIKWLPLEAISRLLDAPDEETVRGKRDRAMMALFVLHGLRTVEMMRLQVSNHNSDEGTLRVCGKGDKWRTAILVEESAGPLARWLEVRDDHAQADEGALFVSLHHPDRGTVLSRRAIRYIVDGYLEELGLKEAKLSCHALRHTFATQSRAAGARLLAISKAMGHASVTTTQVYADIVDRQAENPARFLNGALKKSAS